MTPAVRSATRRTFATSSAFGLRPAACLRGPRNSAWFPISVQGPMARTVEDVALMLTAIAGPDPRSPIAIAEPAEKFAQPLERDFRGTKIAWSRDSGRTCRRTGRDRSLGKPAFGIFRVGLHRRRRRAEISAMRMTSSKSSGPGPLNRNTVPWWKSIGTRSKTR